MSTPTPPAARADVAARMSRAASTWIASLSPEQRSSACWPAPGNQATETERLRWFYTPTDHGGLPLAAQRPAQQRHAMRLVSTGLSPAGYVTVSTIIGWENVLDLVEDYAQTWGRERARDPGLYYLRVFGDPDTDPVWAWRFGGHHVSLNNLVVDGHVHAVTPCFLGADPAAAPALGDTSIRPLAQVEDTARDLITALDADQRHQAVLLDRAPADIIGGNRSRITHGDTMISLPDLWRDRFIDPDLVELVTRVSDTAETRAGLDAAGHQQLALTTNPKGIPGAAMTTTQRELLARLVATYTGRAPVGTVPEPDPESIHFAWAGPTQPGQPHYYRLQGSGFLAEWDNTQRDANHGHSVWRNPDQDFGLDLLAAHRNRHH